MPFRTESSSFRAYSARKPFPFHVCTMNADGSGNKRLTENQKKNRERLTGEAEYRCFIRKPFPFLFAETLLLPQYRADGKLRSFKEIR